MMKACLVACSLLLAGPATAQPVNDLLVDFGPRGLWVFLNNSTWQKLDDQSPEAVAACTNVPPGETYFYASFTGRGLLGRISTGFDWFNDRPEVPQHLAAGDTDNNGKCDLYGVLFDAPVKPSGTLFTTLNRDPTFKVQRHFPWARGPLALGDLDANPNDEVVVGAPKAGVWVSFNNLEPSRFTDDLLDLALGDIDGDGRDEIVGTIGGSSPKLGYVNPPGTGLKTLVDGADFPALAVGNLDNDPREDIVFSDKSPASTFVLFNNTPPAVRISSNYAFNLAIMDLDNDETNDVIADFGSRGVFVRYGPAGFQLLRAWRSESLTPCECDRVP